MAIFHTDKLSFVLHILGAILSLGMNLAPLPTFSDILRKNSAEGFQLLPYQINLTSTIFTLYYVILKNEENVIILINGIEVLIQSAFVIIGMIYSPETRGVLAVCLTFILDILIPGAAIVLTSYVPKIHAVWLSILIRICGFALPFDFMIKTIVKGKAESISYFFSSLSIVCAITWLCYGLLMKDVFVMVSYTIGILVGISQIICYIVYKREGGENVEMDLELTFNDPTPNPNSTAEQTRQRVSIAILGPHANESPNCTRSYLRPIKLEVPSPPPPSPVRSNDGPLDLNLTPRHIYEDSEDEPDLSGHCTARLKRGTYSSSASNSKDSKGYIGSKYASRGSLSGTDVDED